VELSIIIFSEMMLHHTILFIFHQRKMMHFSSSSESSRLSSEISTIQWRNFTLIEVLNNYVNSSFQNILSDNAIQHNTNTVYTPQQNGYIEHHNRTINDCAKSMIHSNNLPLHLWAESINTAVYLINRTINK